MSLSESNDSRVLDEVRAKIFYLASDVETASQPAAMLLRAVAESIVDVSQAVQVNGRLNGQAILKSAAESRRSGRDDEIRTPRVRGNLLPQVQHVGAAGSRSGHKR